MADDERGAGPVPFRPAGDSAAPTPADVTSPRTSSPGTVLVTLPSTSAVVGAGPRSALDVASTAPSTTVPSTTVPSTPAPSGVPPTAPPAGEGVSREVPPVIEVASAPAPPGPWADVTRTTAAGYVATDVGCATGTSAAALDAFFRERLGPVIGDDYQHVYPLGGGRYLWLFQDTFIDHSRHRRPARPGRRSSTTRRWCRTAPASRCYHRGIDRRTGVVRAGHRRARRCRTWFWPMGGELSAASCTCSGSRCTRTAYEPGPATASAGTRCGRGSRCTTRRRCSGSSFQPAPEPGVAPIYGYAVASEGEYTYLFGNTFEQNLAREGGFGNGPHSATAMYLARVPAGQFGSAPEYRTGRRLDA